MPEKMVVKRDIVKYQYHWTNPDKWVFPKTVKINYAPYYIGVIISEDTENGSHCLAYDMCGNEVNAYKCCHGRCTFNNGSNPTCRRIRFRCKCSQENCKAERGNNFEKFIKSEFTRGSIKSRNKTDEYKGAESNHW